MSRNLIILGVVAIVLIGGVVLFAGKNKPESSSTSVPTQAEQATEASPSPEAGSMENETGEKVSVEIKNFAFGPKTITVKKGTTVTWTNQDTVGHTVTADKGAFDTGLLAKGESGSVTFDKLGAFTYHCTPHPTMKATIVVE